MSHTMPGMPRPVKHPLPPIDLGDESLGERLARLRKERGYTQTELARIIGTRQTIVSDYECERIRPHIEMAVRLARALEVTVDELVGAAPQNSTALKNQRFLRRLKQLESLPNRDQDALVRMMDSLISNAQTNGKKRKKATKKTTRKK